MKTKSSVPTNQKYHEPIANIQNTIILQTINLKHLKMQKDCLWSLNNIRSKLECNIK